MSRIRSTHPGQWTDEDFVACSPLARLLCLGLRNEADDQGVFEWKPTTLKMRLLPVDNADVSALLAELEAHKQVCKFELSGRQFGAIRNFRKYQRPKKPNSVYVLPPEFRTYVGLSGGNFPTGSEPDTGLDEVNSPTRSEPVRESAEQMEEGGGRRKDVEEEVQDINPIPPGSGALVVRQSDLLGDDDDALDLPMFLDRSPEGQAVALWNAAAERLGLAQVQKLTNARRTKLKARLRDCKGIDGWKYALEKLAATPWMLGNNDRGWRADFDFLLQEKSFTKLLEGAYDRTAGTDVQAHADAWTNLYGDDDEPDDGARIAIGAR